MYCRLSWRPAHVTLWQLGGWEMQMLELRSFASNAQAPVLSAHQAATDGNGNVANRHCYEKRLREKYPRRPLSPPPSVAAEIGDILCLYPPDCGHGLLFLCLELATTNPSRAAKYLVPRP